VTNVLDKHFRTPSFFDWLAGEHPEHLPRFSAPSQVEAVPHGTTVLAIKYSDGALLAGDRLATEGIHVADRRVQKVYRTDEHSAIAISGAAGVSIEMVRLFQTELEHYEKLEGVPLSTDGKANKLAQMIRANLPAAMQGLAVVPLLIAYDQGPNQGRICKYDVTGGRYEEAEFYATGSGGQDARNTLNKGYRPGMSEEEAIALAIEALQDAADQTLGTGGIDLDRGIFPSIFVATREGVREIPDEAVRRIFLASKTSKGKGGQP
jgi:proteasome beta subunit